ncbi:MAG: DUF502 domain-containing protein [Patescibacteria group bacterium]
MWKKIRAYLGTGLLVIMPAFITGYILWLAFGFTDRLLGKILQQATGRHIPGLGILAILFLLFLAGLTATNYLGKRVLRWLERSLSRVPFVGGIYGTTKQFAEALSSPDRGVFRRVVLVEYPRRGLYSLGFLTGEAGLLRGTVHQELANVFVPTVPNPTTGFLIHVPVSELMYPDLTVDEGLKFIISAGVVKPAGQVRSVGEE